MKDNFALFIPLPLSNNNAGQTRHWSAANKQKQAFANMLALFRLKGTPPDHKCRVTITRILGKGESLWDADSVLRGNAKQLLDALVDAGYFHDDGPKYIEEVFGKQDATRRKDGPAIVVEIQEV
jgi:hypothetical protein